MLDKIKGALFGVAIGDALGATTEFMTKKEIQEKYGKVTELVGGGHWQLKAGEVTDDTELTIAVIKGIMTNSTEPIDEIGKQFLFWKKSNPADIGITIRKVMDRFQGNWFEAAEETHYDLNSKSAGNGSLMRCLPIALAYSDKKKIRELSVLHSKMTHYDDLAAEACVIYNQIASRVLDGEHLKQAILYEIKDTRYDNSYDVEPDCQPDGYVVHTMRWVLYWLLTSESFEEVVVGAANMGNDSDTVAAIAGGLKGMEVGFGKLPRKYTANLLCNTNLNAYAHVLEQIRDQDTEQLMRNLDLVIFDLGNHVNHLKDLVNQERDYQEKKATLVAIKDHIYRLRLSCNDDNHDFELKLETWRMAEIRYRRMQRLFDLGAPKIILLNEIKWLTTMVEHMDQRHRGIDPQFTEDELEELELEAQI